MFGFFQFDLRKAILVIFVIALPLVSINVQHQPGETPWYLKPVLAVGSMAQSTYSRLVFIVRDTTQEYLNLVNIKKNNRLLHEKLQELEAQMASFKELQLENKRLNGLLEFKDREPLDLVGARVIGFDLFAQYSTIRINRGVDHGVAVGQGVITPQGVVGSILTVDASSAQVLVLTDRYSVVDAIVQRSRARGIIEGKTQTRAQLKYLQRTDDVETGDLVVTSGLDSSLPAGFPVGKITSIDKKPFGITQYVEVEPMIEPIQLEEVFVIRRVLENKGLQAHLEEHLRQ